MTGISIYMLEININEYTYTGKYEMICKESVYIYIEAPHDRKEGNYSVGTV